RGWKGDWRGAWGDLETRRLVAGVVPGQLAERLVAPADGGADRHLEVGLTSRGVDLVELRAVPSGAEGAGHPCRVLVEPERQSVHERLIVAGGVGRAIRLLEQAAAVHEMSEVCTAPAGV